jgi:uncharacterized membrane protein
VLAVTAFISDVVLWGTVDQMTPDRWLAFHLLAATGFACLAVATGILLTDPKRPAKGSSHERFAQACSSHKTH